ncbi:hypothetical protein SAMN05518846_108243 [Brevibacillus centrosporus]|uniref:Acetyltransferase (GNAT) domain-containing protein n=1 Tax=Brevibacillus centrosporus TaxID=54910 RepID=A0A1I3WNE6_9BACL|nr:hypothetical protein [Brevibacillus centrosporus]SFK09224.1 hypothetical protein SAMN05518846_108243 [Brevibacillus centrosporus]
MRADLLKMRPLLQQDAPFLVKWLSDERVLHYYEGRDRPHDLQLVHEHFYPKDDDTSRCLFSMTDILSGTGSITRWIRRAGRHMDMMLLPSSTA